MQHLAICHYSMFLQFYADLALLTFFYTVNMSMYQTMQMHVLVVNHQEIYEIMYVIQNNGENKFR